MWGTKYDSANFTQLQGGPGGAGVLNLGEVGGGTPQAAGALPGVGATAAAPGSSGFRVAPVVWMFVFLVVGYIGVHHALKAV